MKMSEETKKKVSVADFCQEEVNTKQTNGGKSMQVSLEDFMVLEEEPQLQFETMKKIEVKIRPYGRNEFFQVNGECELVQVKGFKDWDDNKLYLASSGFLTEHKLKADTYVLVPCVNRDGEMFFAYFNASKLYPGSFDRALKDFFAEAKHCWLKIDYDRQIKIPVATKALNQDVEPEWSEDITSLLHDAITEIAITDIDHPYMVKTLGC